MPHEIRIPRLGWSMEEGIFVAWRKQAGEQVAAGEVLFVLEGEKAVEEIEAPAAGILHVREDAPAPGGIVPVGMLLGYLLGPGESAADLPAAGSARELPGSAAPAVEPAPPPPAGIEAPVSAGVGASGVRGRDPIASPRARRVAAELGIDWRQLPGSGSNGRIREADVRAAQGGSRPARASAPAVGLSGERFPLSVSRRTIGERLRISRERTLPVTLTATVDATNLVALREQFRSAGSAVVPAYTDIAVCLAAQALRRHPTLAGRWEADHGALRLPDEHGCDIGLAVATDEGLRVVVVRDVGHKSLVDVARESRELIARARRGQLTAAEMQGGVFTISNLGTQGIDAFTPIINYPEVAILGMGAIRREAVVLADDRIVPRDRIVLSLTFDHAAVDGSPAAAFLRDLGVAMENPAALLLAGSPRQAT